MESIKSARDFRTAYKCGRKKASALFVLFVCRNNLDIPRLGVSVSKKIGKAHRRNKVRRWLRECCRADAAAFARGFDYVFLARTPVGSLGGSGYGAVRDAAQELVRSVRI